MTSFAHIWVSTDEQLDRLQHSFASASVLTKLLGLYAFPEETAHMRGHFMPWVRAPLVFIAVGEATIAGSRFGFAAKPYHVPAWHVRAVRGDLMSEVDLARADIEPAEFHSPFARMFDIPFTRVRTDQPGLRGNFLVCVGGRFSLPKIRARSIELRAALALAAAG